MQSASTWIDWLNIGLMLAAAGLAYVIPFELFLFAYAVLGPLHYLTEISWLHERRYFATGRYDAVWLALLAVGLFCVSVVPALLPPALVRSWGWTECGLRHAGAGITYLAFISGLAMVVCQRPLDKLLLVVVGFFAMLALMRLPLYLILFTVFLPTLIHVFVFTAAFMLLGALKSRSKPGLFAVVLLLLLGAGLLCWRDPPELQVSDSVRRVYGLFQPLNEETAALLGVRPLDVYHSALGLAIMRFIAFAYTYHYLNWFSKTSIIKWHEVDRRRLAGIVVLWLLSVGLYVYHYQLGFIALYTLSFLHVFLEFPLNHQSFLGIGRELARRWRPAMPAST